MTVPNRTGIDAQRRYAFEPTADQAVWAAT
jgi:hypothetical protein